MHIPQFIGHSTRERQEGYFQFGSIMNRLDCRIIWGNFPLEVLNLFIHDLAQTSGFLFSLIPVHTDIADL